MFTERIEQRRARVECERVGATVDVKSHCHEVRRRPRPGLAGRARKSGIADKR
jgi:hypothetical protein